MNPEGYFAWIKERQSIFLKKEEGLPFPWSEDWILTDYKFTNIWRENDRVTRWMRTNWTNQRDQRPLGDILFNTCVFRMFGTSEFAGAVGWSSDSSPWDAQSVIRLARDRLSRKERVFTGAYIITNQGLTLPKEEVVVNHFLTPLWDIRHDLASQMQSMNSLEGSHRLLGRFKGWGGGGFMAYEVVTDLNYTPLLIAASDRYTWANAGPGAKRGLNRMHERPLNFEAKTHGWNGEMQELLILAAHHLPPEIHRNPMCDMRMIEHCLCEWDKYERVRLGEGKPRSRYMRAA